MLTWLLQRYDEEPAWFGPWERQGVLFSFTWATSALLPHPDVPLAQIEAALADMSARYKAARESHTPVLKVRYDVAAHRHGYAEADEAYEAWTIAQTVDLETGTRSELSDCEWCEPADKVRHLAATGRADEAVAIALPVLDGPVECRTQPFAMIAAAMEPLLLTGQADRAALEHLRGVRLLRMHVDDDAGDPRGTAPRPGARARHRDAGPGRAPDAAGPDRPAGTRAGAARAVDAVARRQGRARPPGDGDRGRRWTVLKSVTEAGGGDVAITTGRWGEVSAERLAGRLAGRARELAARFDARNGTDAATRRVEAMLTAEALPELPLDPIGRSPQFARIPVNAAAARRGRRVARIEGPQSLADSGDLVGLAKAYEQAAEADSEDRKEAVLAAWRSTRLIYTDLEDDDVEGSRAAARLDGWMSVSDLERDEGGDGEANRTAAADAADRLRRAGLSVQALLHEQACVLATASAGRIDAAEAMTRIGKTAAQVAAEGGPGQIGLAYCRLALAREAGVRAGVPEPDPAVPAPRGDAGTISPAARQAPAASGGSAGADGADRSGDPAEPGEAGESHPEPTRWTSRSRP